MNVQNLGEAPALVRLTPREAIDVADGALRLGFSALSRAIDFSNSLANVEHGHRIAKGEIPETMSLLSIEEEIIEVPIREDDGVWFIRRAMHEADLIRERLEAQRQQSLVDQSRPADPQIAKRISDCFKKPRHLSVLQ